MAPNSFETPQKTRPTWRVQWSFDCFPWQVPHYLSDLAGSDRSPRLAFRRAFTLSMLSLCIVYVDDTKFAHVCVALCKCIPVSWNVWALC